MYAVQYEQAGDERIAQQPCTRLFDSDPGLLKQRDHATECGPVEIEQQSDQLVDALPRRSAGGRTHFGEQLLDAFPGTLKIQFRLGSV